MMRHVSSRATRARARVRAVPARSRAAAALVIAASALGGLVASAAGQTADEAEVGGVLDALHRAASEADFEGYFGLYAEEFVFLGTDATERWGRSEFMEYARGPFSEGRGWTYTPVERWVTVAPDGRTAWFDERLENAGLGETRGSGVLVLEGGGWKVAQYNLTIPIPNELAREFVARIRERAGGRP